MNIDLISAYHAWCNGKLFQPQPIHIVWGPAGSGKSRIGQQLALAVGATQLVDAWDGLSPLPAGALALTNAEAFDVPHGAKVLSVRAATLALAELERHQQT